MHRLLVLTALPLALVALPAQAAGMETALDTASTPAILASASTVPAARALAASVPAAPAVQAKAALAVATPVDPAIASPDEGIIAERAEELELAQRAHMREVKASREAQAAFVEKRRAEIEAARKAAEEAARKAAEAAAQAAARAAAAQGSTSGGGAGYAAYSGARSTGYSSSGYSGASGYSGGAASYSISASGNYNGWNAQQAVDTNDIAKITESGRTIYAGHNYGSAGQFSQYKSGDTVTVAGEGTYRITNTVRVARGSTFGDVPAGTAFQTCEDGQLVLRYAEKIG